MRYPRIAVPFFREQRDLPLRTRLSEGMLLNIAALGLLVAPHRVSVHRAVSAQMGLYDLSATRIDGASVAMADFKGKPLVVVVRKH